MFESSKEVLKSYKRSFKKYGHSTKSLHWMTPEAARLRYRELLVDINLEGKSILDVGCGFGDILPFISDNANKFDYVGIDLVPDFVNIARSKHPKYSFLVGDYFKKPLAKKFDVVVCSGALNSSILNADKYRKEAIKIMYEHAMYVVAFNMAGSHPQPKNRRTSRVHYSDSLEIIDFCTTLTSSVILRQHYRSKDFTVFLYPCDREERRG